MKKCKECGCDLNKKNSKVYLGVKYLRCKKCISNKIQKYNDKRKKILKDNKWF